MNRKERTNEQVTLHHGGFQVAHIQFVDLA
jgi:hypothetical protein